MSEIDRKIIELLKSIDFPSLLCVPVVKAEIGLGVDGVMQNVIPSEPINLLNEDVAVEEAKIQLEALIEACNSAIKQIGVKSLRSADIVWRHQQEYQPPITGRFFAWMLTEPMPNVTTTHFKPVS